jgi:hypothetical protein
MQNHEVTAPDKLRRWILIVWPAFLAACLLEAFVFSMVDPGEVHWSGHMLQPSRQGVYSVAFFGFWVITMAANALVLWLAEPEIQVNDTAAD